MRRGVSFSMLSGVAASREETVGRGARRRVLGSKRQDAGDQDSERVALAGRNDGERGRVPRRRRPAKPADHGVDCHASSVIASRRLRARARSHAADFTARPGPVNLDSPGSVGDPPRRDLRRTPGGVAPMTLLRALAVVSVAAWLGIMAFFSFEVAPVVFKTIDRAIAGQAVAAVLPRYYRWGLALTRDRPRRLGPAGDLGHGGPPAAPARHRARRAHGDDAGLGVGCADAAGRDGASHARRPGFRPGAPGLDPGQPRDTRRRSRLPDPRGRQPAAGA